MRAPVIVADLNFRRRVSRLCERPRLVAEMLAELAAERMGWADIDERLERYTRLDPEALALTGGDQFPPTPLHLIPVEEC
jgi:hypothetical protein